MLQVNHVNKSYRAGGIMSHRKKQILFDISFETRDGECMGIIGESGTGKSTLGRLILGLEKPDSGQILYDGGNVRRRSVRRGVMSAVFQDYSSSMNPYNTVEKTMAEPLRLAGIPSGDMRDRTVALLEQVGLDGSYLTKFPHEMSGGEAQRVCIARAISTNPKFILLDEAISSLDASVAYQILVLLKQLKNELNATFLFITHDIHAVRFLCDRTAFFNGGRLLEMVDVKDIDSVKDPYSQRLMSSVFSI